MITNSPVKLWRNQKKIRSRLGLSGNIISFTKIYVPPVGFESLAPYPVVLVKTEKGVVIGQLVDYCDKDLRIGKKVIAVLRRVTTPGKEGVIPYGIKFKSISDPNHLLGK